MNPITTFTGRVVAIPNENIDTDQITPARFLKVVDKLGMDKYLFADWRYAPDGTPRTDFALNQPSAQGAQILLAGDNFGCGSSREHAPWALVAYGFRAIISTSFGDIFKSNALKNGLLPIAVDCETHRELFDLVTEIPGVELTVDLASQSLFLPDQRQVSFPIDPFGKTCLLQGVDELGYLLSHQDTIAQFEREHAL